MCGIAGILHFGGAGAESLQHAVRRMSAALRHRGPDAAGVWVDPVAGIALGHRRLAVVELSELGSQPMESACGRFVTVFNGEIYNFKELRKELEGRGRRFRGNSDTEVLLAATSEWGLSEALARFRGMFAIALWDRRWRRLFLIRDRAGEKPLYYGTLGRSFVFGSELGALRQHPAGLGEIDRDAMALYLRFGYVPAPYSIYSRVRKLPPGCVVEVDEAGCVSRPAPFWSCEAAARAGLAEPLRTGAPEAIEQLDCLLSDAVRLQTFADVPLGAFLSGGVDSSAIVAMMCRHARRVRTFTIGFDEDGFDEARHARAVAHHLGTVHTELRVTASDAIAVLPQMPQLYGEPFADSSQIPMFLVSKLARQHVTVALSGDGGDELFGGYDRYLWADVLWGSMRRCPRAIRSVIGSALQAVPPYLIDRGIAAIAPVLPAALRVRHPGDKAHKVAGLLSAEGAGDVYRMLVSSWRDPASILQSGAEPPEAADRFTPREFRHRMMLLDTVTYLPDDILVKVDRASMGTGLEARAPFLDHRLIEFAWRLPLDLKLRNGQAKWLLKQVLHRYVPQSLVDRPKAGFAIPLHDWVRGPLRPWAEELISGRSLEAGGFFRAAPVRRKWREHLSGTRNWIAPLWAVLSFQAWHEQQESPGPAETSCELRAAGAI